MFQKLCRFLKLQNKSKMKVTHSPKKIVKFFHKTKTNKLRFNKKYRKWVKV